VEGKGNGMNTTTTSQGAAISSQSRLMQLALSALLGVFVIGFVGFSHVEAAHNAGHDYRHSMAFPCH
jgi:cobalt transporter subunit CbtB